MSLLALATYGDSDDDSDSEPELAQGKVATLLETKQAVRRLVPVVSGGRKSDGSKQPVRIAIPKVDKGGEESDEEDTPAPKRAKAGGGLTAFLPAPKGRGPKKIGLQVTTSTTVSKTAPSSLVPYSVTKKKNSAGEGKGKQHSKQARNVNSDNEESGDEENITFFSHLQSPTKKEASSDFVAQNAESTSQHLDFPSSTSSSSFSSVMHCHPISYSTPALPADLHHSPASVSPSPSTGELQYGYVSHSLTYPGQAGYTGIPSHDGCTIAASGMDGSTVIGGTAPSPEQRAQGATTLNQDDILEMNEAAMLKLAGGGGRKGRRKRQEEFSLQQMVDISEKEVKDTVKAYQKYSTEEHSHTSGTVPKDLVYNSTQKRKHQMVWLAHQAKERELELKNFWAQAAATKRQTQFKYGF